MIDPELIVHTDSPFYSGFVWAQATERSTGNELIGKIYLGALEDKIDHFSVSFIGTIRAYPARLIEDLRPLTKQEIFKYTLEGKIR